METREKVASAVTHLPFPSLPFFLPRRAAAGFGISLSHIKKLILEKDAAEVAKIGGAAGMAKQLKTNETTGLNTGAVSPLPSLPLDVC